LDMRHGKKVLLCQPSVRTNAAIYIWLYDSTCVLFCQYFLVEKVGRISLPGVFSVLSAVFDNIGSFQYDKQYAWGRSSAGRALLSHSRGRGFKSLRLHWN